MSCSRSAFIATLAAWAGSGRWSVEASAPRLAQQAIAQARAYSLKHGEKALLIEQSGEMLHESYAAGTTSRERLKIYSGTKLYWCLAALAAVEDGLLGLDEPVAQHLPAWAGEKGKSSVTLRQLLDFTSGLAPAFELHQDGLSNRDALALGQRLVAARGEAFIYGPASLQVVHALLASVLSTRGQTPVQYLERRVLRPLRLGSQRYLADATGHPLLAAGFMQTAREWLRMGRLILRQGEGVISAPSFQQALRGSRANSAYSMGLWNNRAASSSRSREVDIEAMLHKKWPEQHWSRPCLCRAAPADLLACIGSHGQRLYVFPSQSLIIVRLANSESFNDAGFLRALCGVG